MFMSLGPPPLKFALYKKGNVGWVTFGKWNVQAIAKVLKECSINFVDVAFSLLLGQWSQVSHFIVKDASQKSSQISLDFITCFTRPLKNVMLFPRKDNSVRENIFSSPFSFNNYAV